MMYDGNFHNNHVMYWKYRRYLKVCEGELLYYKAEEREVSVYTSYLFTEGVKL